MQYEQELFAQRTPYLQWLREQKAEFDETYGEGKKPFGKQICRLPFYSCMDCMEKLLGDFDSTQAQENVIYLFFNHQGMVCREADGWFAKAFSDNPDAVLAYADEDYLGTLDALYGIPDESVSQEIREALIQPDKGLFRGEPWFKPDYSPDTLDSFFYIGNLFAIEGSTLAECIAEYGTQISLCDLIRKLSGKLVKNKKADRVVHIPKVLFTNDRLETKKELAGWTGGQNEAQGKHKDYGRVSVIIPSRDNEPVLRRCIETLTAYTSYTNYELIIVDNGSTDENRLCIAQLVQELQEQKGVPEVQYLYHRMEFNFSKMCNIGAEAASGNYLLFLNDDIEVMEQNSSWLDEMLRYASMEHVGAVGAKLYYPRQDHEDNACYKIQHTGITNMAIGPAHKLGGMEDQGNLYHGHNLAVYDMLAVTAACMLIKRSTFQAAGGFDEELAVAYNDVELCFRLYEAGLYNVQANGAVLLHHESLSRGQDTSPEKQGRLENEKKRLYGKHPALEGRDPFYSPNLVQWKKDITYSTNYQYAFDQKKEPVRPETASVFAKYDLARRIRAKSRYLGKLYDRITGSSLPMLQIDSIEEDKTRVIIRGWFVLRRRDNADLHRKLWLIRITRDEDYRRVYEFPVSPQLRDDVAAIFAGDEKTKNTALSGIQLIFDRRELKKGTYITGVISDQSGLVCSDGKTIEI